MRAAAWAAVLCAIALSAACDSNEPPGLAHPRIVNGKVIGPGPSRQRERSATTVDFVTGDRGFLATEAGQILATSDGGRSWRERGRGLTTVRALDFVSPSHGFALIWGTWGSQLRETSDGGRSWHVIHAFPNGKEDRSDAVGRGLVFPDARHGWVTTTRGLFRTRDGGRTWEKLEYPCRGYDSPVGPGLADSQDGYVVCAGQPATDMQFKEIYVTDDGGDTWIHRAGTTVFRAGQRDPLPVIGAARGLVVRSPSAGLLLSDRGGIDRTGDGGRSWRTILATDDVDEPLDVSWPTANRIYALTFHAGLLRSDDGGRHWKIVYPHDRAGPEGPSIFFSPSRGLAFKAEDLAGGQRAVFATQDGGRSWRLQATLPTRFGPERVFRFGPTALAASSDALARSGDGGRHWARIFSMPRGRFGSFSFVSSEVGYYVDDAHHLFRTEDGGSTWKSVRSNARELEGAVFVTDEQAYVVTYEPPPGTGEKPVEGVEELVRSTDGGRTWRAVRAPLMGRVMVINRLDDRRWWFFAVADCGHDGRCREQVWRTRDGGDHWDLIRLPKEITGEFASFVTPAVGYAGSATSGLYRTEDGGATWTYVRPAQP